MFFNMVFKKFPHVSQNIPIQEKISCHEGAFKTNLKT